MTIDLNTTSNKDLREKLEAEQDARLNATTSKLTHETAEQIAERIAKGGFKVKQITEAFRKEEDLRTLIERERDDNLKAYLEEREEKVKLIVEVNALNKQISDRDASRAEQVELQRKNRDAEITQSQTQKELNDLSRQSFKELLESRNKFRANK